MSIEIILAGIGQKFFEYSQFLVKTFGYFGIFAVAAISASTVILPTFPLSALVFISASFLNPVLLGISAGLGSATGELVGYVIGKGSQEVLLKKYKKRIDRMQKMFSKYKAEFVIFFFAMLPIIPFDVIGLASGVIGFNWKKFFVAVAAGKTVRYLIIAFAGYYGVSLVYNYLGE